MDDRGPVGDARASPADRAGWSGPVGRPGHAGRHLERPAGRHDPGRRVACCRVDHRSGSHPNRRHHPEHHPELRRCEPDPDGTHHLGRHDPGRHDPGCRVDRRSGSHPTWRHRSELRRLGPHGRAERPVPASRQHRSHVLRRVGSGRHVAQWTHPTAARRTRRSGIRTRSRRGHRLARTTEGHHDEPLRSRYRHDHRRRLGHGGRLQQRRRHESAVRPRRDHRRSGRQRRVAANQGGALPRRRGASVSTLSDSSRPGDPGPDASVGGA